MVSTSDDPANSKLTVMTSDAPLTDFASSGAAAVSENSVVYELDANGTLTRAVAVTGTLEFPRIGYDLSGSEFKLKSDGYEAKVKGLTYSSGSGMTLVKVTATDYSWWFTPRVRAGMELDLGGMKSFQAIASGQVSSSTVLDGEVLLAGVSVKRTIYDLPEASEPKTVVYLGNIGLVPVYATLGFDFSLKSKADAKALLDFGVTYRQETSASFGISYERGSPLDWTSAFQATSPDFRGTLGLTGEFSYELSLDPRIEFLIYGLAGISAGVEPSAEVTASVSTSGGLGGKLEASLDFVLAAAGPAFDFLNIEKELTYSIWEGEWPIEPQTLAFKTQPQSQTVAPGGNVSFTCTVDSPSNPIFQWYHNSSLLPGQTARSLFLPAVAAGHAGSYFVRVKAGNQTVDSATATLTVQTVTPQNRDTDGDGILDLYETNTGTWVSATNTGTNPYKCDSDSDGLSDGVESNTRVYVSRSNTGTDPNQYDTDGDGVNDKREIDLGTNPNAAPAPDGFAYIPAGWFTMGQDGIATPVHSVYESAFYMGRYEVTKELWDSVRAWGLNNGYTDLAVGNGSYASKGANHPVHSITWHDMVKWCNARSEMEGLAPCYAFVSTLNAEIIIPSGTQMTVTDPTVMNCRSVILQDSAMLILETASTITVPSLVINGVPLEPGNYGASGSGATRIDDQHFGGIGQIDVQNGGVACNWNANGYRLPTEAEWEKSARGGVSGKNFPWGSDTISQSQANYRVYSSNGTTNHHSYDVTPRPPATGDNFYHPLYAVGDVPYSSPVGSFAANGYGLYDMAGNMRERCWDWIGGYAEGPQTDPRGPVQGSNFRVIRGGGWDFDASLCRAAFRAPIGSVKLPYNNVGFRLARSSVP